MSESKGVKPTKVIVDNVPAYKRQYVLPITSAVQSIDSWRWPPPEKPDYSLLDRLLNSTTLTTQCVTHQHILEIGEHAHSDLTTDLKVRIAEIERMQKSFINIVAQEVQKVKTEMEIRYKQLLAQSKGQHQVQLSDKWDHKLETMLELEKEKIIRLEAEWKLRMEDAMIDQRNALDAEYKLNLAAAIKEVEDRLNADIDGRVAAALKKQLEILETTPGTGGYRDRLDKQVEDVTTRHREELDRLRQELTQQHDNEIKSIRSKWTQMCDRYKQLLEFSRNVERDYLLLEEDFRRFVNNVKGAGGHFGSDYLMRSKQHGLVVMHSEKPAPVKIENPPDFESMKKRSERRQLNLMELAAISSDPSFWPDSHFADIDNNLTDNIKPPSHQNKFVPVKLIRPLDSDEIGNVSLPLYIPEQNGASFILSFSDL